MNIIFLLLVSVLAKFSEAQEMNLYTGNIPNSIPNQVKEHIEHFGNGHVSYANVTQPRLIPYIARHPNATKAAVIICPGGGYGRLAAGHEGAETAKAFNAIGVSAFVLIYRLPSDSISLQKELVAFQDVQQAIKIVREKADTWGVNPNLIGVLGYSAGGHLASTIATRFSETVIDNPTNTSLRPNFSMLIYPVITMDKTFTHIGSRKNLLGNNPSEAVTQKFSNELNVSSQTPITFMVHAADDKAVPILNSLRYYEALIKNNIPVAAHFYQNGGHGFGLHNAMAKEAWFDRLTNWLTTNKIIE